MTKQVYNDNKFLSWLTLALIGASLWIFGSYLHYLLVAAVLALATSHIYSGLTSVIGGDDHGSLRFRSRETITATVLTLLFLLLIFTPLVYFVSMTYKQIGGLDLEVIRETAIEAIERLSDLLGRFDIFDEPLARLREEGLSFVTGPAAEMMIGGATGLIAGVGSLLGQITWILVFYFLFNLYGMKILRFIGELLPMSYEHEHFLYRECTGTVSVVFYGTLFNMVAQGLSFGLLMVFIGDYDAVYLGILSGFCSVIPLVGAALVYIPVVVLELLDGNYLNIAIILLFAWVVMGFFIDNVLKIIFIGMLKKRLGFEYTMNEILILMAILAGIASFGFWGLVIGPSVLALTLAAASLYSRSIDRPVEQE